MLACVLSELNDKGNGCFFGASESKVFIFNDKAHSAVPRRLPAVRGEFADLVSKVSGKLPTVCINMAVNVEFYTSLGSIFFMVVVILLLCVWWRQRKSRGRPFFPETFAFREIRWPSPPPPLARPGSSNGSPNGSPNYSPEGTAPASEPPSRARSSSKGNSQNSSSVKAKSHSSVKAKSVRSTTHSTHSKQCSKCARLRSRSHSSERYCPKCSCSK